MSAARRAGGLLSPGPDISVVVPTRGRPEMLERCLRALTEQSLDRERYEILVVDDGPSPETRDAVNRVARHSGVRTFYVPGHSKGPSAARNAGWRSAAGAVVAFTDDDTVPDREWLASGLDAMSGGAAAASGSLVMPLSEHPTDYERDAAGLADAEFVTANCFCRKDALRAVGGFDERFPLAWREDTDLQFSLLEYGLRVTCAPEAVVVHPVRPAPWGTSLRQQVKAEYNALLHKKHPQLYRERIGHSPRWYYLAAGSALAALAALLSGRKIRARLWTAVWAVFTMGFALKRLRGTSKRPAHVFEMLVTSALIPFLSLYRRLKGALRFRTLFW